jgi:hypothetical protein
MFGYVLSDPLGTAAAHLITAFSVVSLGKVIVHRSLGWQSSGGGDRAANAEWKPGGGARTGDKLFGVVQLLFTIELRGRLLSHCWGDSR